MGVGTVGPVDGGFHAIDYIGGGLAVLAIVGCIVLGIRIVLGALGLW